MSRSNPAQATMAKKRAAKAERHKIVTPDPKTRNGQVVEITGKAKVDATDAIGSTKSDHQGAVARVEGHYYSEERGCQMATVRTEDNKVRVIPEDRLTDIDEAINTEATEAGSPRASMTGICSPERWDSIFGAKPKHANLMTNAARRAAGRPQDPDLDDYRA